MGARLAGKVALVTGAGRGIGRASALALAREGAGIVVNYARDEAAAADVVDLVRTKGGNALAAQADVARSDQVQSLVERALSWFGRVDILVNNAGVIIPRPLDEITDRIWEEVIGVNLTGSFLCCRAVAPVMLGQGGGKIVNIASLAGLISGGPRGAAYSAAKAGVIGLTRTLAECLAPHVQVNAIAPGVIDTDMTAPVKQRGVERIVEQTPARRLGTAAEVAEAVLFLTADAGFITGQVLVMDGGLGNVFVH